MATALTSRAHGCTSLEERIERRFDETSERRVLTFERLNNRVTHGSATLLIFRAKIPGGWLVATRPNDSITFVPDPEHEWDGGSLA